MAIDLRKLLINGLGITRITAEDAGLDGLQEKYQDNESFAVHWDDNVGAFVTSAGHDGKAESNPWLVLDRRDQKDDAPVAQSNQHWLAYQPQLPVEEMERVVWAQYEYRDGNNALIKDEGWISVNPVSGTRRRWVSGAWDEVGTVTSVYDSTLKQYVPT